jgi:hypothetical protein
MEKQEAKNPRFRGAEPDPKQIKGQKAFRVLNKSGTALRGWEPQGERIVLFGLCLRSRIQVTPLKPLSLYSL